MTTLDLVRKSIAGTLGRETRDVGAHGDLFDRLGCNVFGFVDIVLNLELDFGIALADGEVSGCRTPAAFADVIERKWAGAA